MGVCGQSEARDIFTEYLQKMCYDSFSVLENWMTELVGEAKRTHSATAKKCAKNQSKYLSNHIAMC